MSKSLGNFFTVRDLLDQGVPGEVIRFVFLQTHYRKPMDWTKNKATSAKNTLLRWYELAANEEPRDFTPPALVEAIADDLNTPKAIKICHDLFREKRASELYSAIRFLGLLGDKPPSWRPKREQRQRSGYSGIFVIWPENLRVDESIIFELAKQWRDLREEKAYQEADELRRRLQEAGLSLRAAQRGVTVYVEDDFDPAKLEALAQ